jgi:undecaprenyl pyrophosphate phosphatase UppP
MLWIHFVAAFILVGIVAWLVNTYVPATGRIRLIINVVLMLIVVGMALWLINNFVPMAGSIRAILNIVVVVATCVGVLQALGLWDEVVRLWRNLTHHGIPG